MRQQNRSQSAKRRPDGTIAIASRAPNEARWDQNGSSLNTLSVLRWLARVTMGNRRLRDVHTQLSAELESRETYRRNAANGVRSSYALLMGIMRASATAGVGIDCEDSALDLPNGIIIFYLFRLLTLIWLSPIWKGEMKKLSD